MRGGYDQGVTERREKEKKHEKEERKRKQIKELIDLLPNKTKENIPKGGWREHSKEERGREDCDEC